MVFIEEVFPESGSSGCIKEGLPDLSRDTLAADPDVCVAVWIVGHNGVEFAEA
jgi:hypothetical protein